MPSTRTHLETAVVLVVAPEGERASIVDPLTSLDSYSIREAATVAGARSALGESVVCVVLAAGLPDGGEFDLVAECTGERPQRPVVLVTDATEDETLGVAAEAGATVLPTAQCDRLASVVDARASSSLDHRRNRERFDAITQLYEAIGDTLFIKDEVARHRYLSPNVRIPDPEMAMGETDLSLHDSRFEIGRQWYETDMAVLEDGEPVVERTVEHTDTDGNAFYEEVSVVPWREDTGEIQGLVGRRHRITDEILQQQELERKNRRLDQFVDYITHDLQNPLQVAHGYLKLAKEGDENAMAQVENALGRMEDLVEDVETLARGERTEMTAIRSINFVDLVTQIWEMIDTGESSLTVAAPPETVINVSKAEFRPMIQNLLKNALDYGPADVSITIGTLNDGFFVEDDGDGIPVERRDEIFEKGYTTAADGAGTGLAIVADVAEAHEWELDVVEGREGGARFRVRNCLMATEPARKPTSRESLSLTERADVGDLKMPGESVYDEATDTWSVSSAGADIYGQDNDFHFVYTTVEGPVRISGHLSDIEPVHGFSKAGFMIRDALSPDAVHGSVGRTVDWGTELLWCAEAGTGTTSQHLDEGYQYEWFRIDRVGSLVTCWVAEDGQAWQVIDQRRVPYDDPVHVGLVTSSVVPWNPCTATFEAVEVCRLEE